MLLQHSQPRASQAHRRRQVPGRDCALELYLFGIVVFSFLLKLQLAQNSRSSLMK